jgi:hypothetical protein
VVVHIHAELPTQEGSQANWHRVWAHRNSQRIYIEELRKEPDADDWLILFSDLDEIPNVDIVRELKEEKTERAKDWCRRIRGGEAGVFAMEMYYYNPLTLAQYWWQGTRVTTVKMLERFTPQQIRHDTERCGITQVMLPKPFAEMPCLSNPECEEDETGGVHCTYFGDAEFVSHKMKSIAESTGFVTEEMADPERLKKIMAEGLDPYGRTEHIYYRLEKPRKSMPEPVLRRFLKGTDNVPS